MGDKIFISYRRDDAKADARSIYQGLKETFGAERLFIDVDTIHKGQNFEKALERALADCCVMIVVMGANWLDTKNHAGGRRLDEPHDFVSLEVSTALKRSIPVIPVLVNGAIVPAPELLPASLKPLSSMQAAIITHDNFPSDMERLQRDLAELVPPRRPYVKWAAIMASVCAAAVLAVGLGGWLGGGKMLPAMSSTPAGGKRCVEERTAASPSVPSPEVVASFSNQSGSPVRLQWINSVGGRVPYSELPDGRSLQQKTFYGHPWIATDLSNNCIAFFVPIGTSYVFVVPKPRN